MMSNTIIGKTIGELELLGVPTPKTLIPVEYSGKTYHIEYSSTTVYNGSDINCLNIKNGMSMTQVIESIGDVFCSTPTPIIVCGDIILQTPPIGECQNPLQYLFNQSILSWCEEHPPVVPCTSNVNPLEYLFNQVLDSWNEEHPPVVPCTSNVNPLEYLFNEVITSWEKK